MSLHGARRVVRVFDRPPARGRDQQRGSQRVDVGRLCRFGHADGEDAARDLRCLVVDEVRQARPARAVSPELVALYDQRADVPVSTFVDMLTQAREHIDVLVYAAVFLHEAYPRLNDVLRERAAEGCAVRIAVGDPESTNVQERGKEERFGHGIESRCRLALMHYRPLAGVPGIEVRTHATTLYNSIYRADDQAMVNAHVWGVNAFAAPVWHLRRSGEGGMFDTYAGSFDAVWETATPVSEG
ncbi:XRE family transcriptional regulator [Streptomyces gelaticus]